MTDEEKLQRCVDCFERKLRNIETWDQFKDLVRFVTKAQIKSFINNCLGQSSADYTQSAANNVATAGEVDDLIEEVDAL